MISYDPFWLTLDLDEVSTYKLIKEHHISSSTINRLKHNKPVSTATIEKLSVSEPTFNRWLRKELTEELKRKALLAIEEIAREHKAEQTTA